MLGFIVFLAILNLLIIVHELGHYVASKRVGVEVKEFAIGMGPTLFQKEWNNTLWKINLLPIGGYNSLKGETESEGGKGNYSSARKKHKLQILFAGVIMNIALAIVVFYAMFLIFGWRVPSVIEFKPIGGDLVTVKSPNSGPIIFEATSESSIKKENIKLPVLLVKINGEDVSTSAEVVEKINTIGKSGADSVMLTVKDPVTMLNKDVKANFIAESKIGISLGDQGDSFEIDYSRSIWTKLFSGVSHSVNVVILTGTFFKRLVGYVLTTRDLQPVSYSVSGPVGVYSVVNTIVTSTSTTALRDLFHLTGLISLNLGIFNLIPFPGLDGWHILIVVLEKARKKKFNEETLGKISFIGLALLLLVSFLITIKDIVVFLLR